jgi:site-specific recombinase XerD
MTTKKLSYRVFFYTAYSMGQRLSEGLGLKVGDIDVDRMRVHIRDAKGNKDRTEETLQEQPMMVANIGCFPQLTK